MAGKTSLEIPTRAFASVAAWSAWLEAQHAVARGLWLKLAKKGSGKRSISYAEALEVALAWGWIDGQKQSLDETWWLQKFTPRGKTSVWSEINRAKALALIEAGKMQPAGLAEVERAKADGRWKVAYASQKTATVPEDLEAAFAKNARARAFFDQLDSANRYAVLWRIHTAKKPETRASRIATFVSMLANHQKLHP
jgi:uncharacterized protein YdeI (YjbR/CyaY-like superfamily)